MKYCSGICEVTFPQIDDSVSCIPGKYLTYTLNIFAILHMTLDYEHTIKHNGLIMTTHQAGIKALAITAALQIIVYPICEF